MESIYLDTLSISSYINEEGLTEDQKRGMEVFRKGENVVITGPGGTGKTYLIQKIREYCYLMKMKVGITAMTGCAAYLINGNTLHSWAGIGLGEESVSELVKQIKKSRYAKQRWKNTRVLVIDEISMMDKNLFEKMEEISRIMRGNSRMWGGLQICVLGDMCQLPPCGSEFCFESRKWDDTFKNVVDMKKIVRQKDKIFCKCLNEIRFGIVREKTLKLLEECSNRKLDEENSIKPTRLYAYNNKVSKINKEELKKLGENVKKYKCRTDIEIKDYDKYAESESGYHSRMMDKNLQYEEELELAVGAQVMLLINLDVKKGLVNGSRGIVRGFEGDLPVVRFLHGIEKIVDWNSWIRDEDKYKISKQQIPLKLAWACSIHKIQGSTLDLVEVDIKEIFEYGQVYVALSRVRNPECLYIKQYDIKKIKCHPKAIAFYIKLKKKMLNKYNEEGDIKEDRKC